MALTKAHLVDRVALLVVVVQDRPGPHEAMLPVNLLEHLEVVIVPACAHASCPHRILAFAHPEP
jgi:hypothetical protein